MFENLILKIKSKFAVANDIERIHVQYLLVFIILCIVSVVMTVVNIFTHWHVLGTITCLFAVVCALSFICERFVSNKAIGRVFFAIGMIVMFVSFLVTGEPEGFSVHWILLLPSCGFFLFGLKKGLIANAVELLIILFFVWTEVGKSLLMYNYTKPFLQRFPLVYVAFTCVGILLEVVRLDAQNNLDKAKREFEYMYNHDLLTGLYNRYGFNDTMDQFFKKRTDEPLAFAIFDLDFFKSVNDTYGHLNGDKVLQTIAKITSEFFKDNAVVCRWGGEEFSILFYYKEGAEAKCNELLEKARILRIEVDNESIIETFSLGLITVEKGQEVEIGRLVRLADDNLNKAKQNGRNQIVSSEYIPE